MTIQTQKKTKFRLQRFTHRSFLPLLATRTDCKGCMWLLQPHSGEDRWIHSSEGVAGDRRGGGELQLNVDELGDGCVAVGTTQSLYGMQASPGSHTLPAALGWKQKFGSRGRRRSPTRGGKEALTECEAAPLCRPHRTSRLGRAGGQAGEGLEVGNTVHIIIKATRGAKTRRPRWAEWRHAAARFPRPPETRESRTPLSDPPLT